MASDFSRGLADEIDDVFGHHPELVDHRVDLPRLVGALGNPLAPGWFVAENPSLTEVRKLERDATIEAQSSASAGDHLFREALAGAARTRGFKAGGPLKTGGWHCYITDVVESADIVGNWRKRPESERRTIAEMWAPVLAYELDQGKPRVLVVLGEAAEKLLKHVANMLPPLPPCRRIHHYSYLGSRAEGRRGPMHPKRVAEWHAVFADIARQHLRPADRWSGATRLPPCPPGAARTRQNPHAEPTPLVDRDPRQIGTTALDGSPPGGHALRTDGRSMPSAIGPRRREGFVRRL